MLDGRSHWDTVQMAGRTRDAKPMTTRAAPIGREKKSKEPCDIWRNCCSAVSMSGVKTSVRTTGAAGGGDFCMTPRVPAMKEANAVCRAARP